MFYVYGAAQNVTQCVRRRRSLGISDSLGGELAPEANIHIGEGGAGTFSGGKLTNRIKDPLYSRVIERLLAAGAPAEIGWRAKPHIGTDLLQGVFTALRQRLEAMGGKVLFNTRLTVLAVRGGKLAGVETTAGPLPFGALVLAVGPSARDIFATLAENGHGLVVIPFSAGF